MSAGAGVFRAVEIEEQKRRRVGFKWGVERERERRLWRPIIWGRKEDRGTWKFTGQAAWIIRVVSFRTVL